MPSLAVNDFYSIFNNIRRRCSRAWQNFVLHPYAQGMSVITRVPYWIRDPVLLSMCVTLVSLALVASFASTVVTEGELKAMMASANSSVLHPLGVSTVPPFDCSGCVLVRMAPPTDTLNAWVHFQVGAKGAELICSYIIATMVVLFSAFLVHSCVD